MSDNLLMSHVVQGKGSKSYQYGKISEIHWNPSLKESNVDSISLNLNRSNLSEKEKYVESFIERKKIVATKQTPRMGYWERMEIELEEGKIKKKFDKKLQNEQKMLEIKKEAERNISWEKQQKLTSKHSIEPSKKVDNETVEKTVENVVQILKREEDPHLLGIRRLHQTAMIFKWIWNNCYTPMFKYPSQLDINGNYLDDEIMKPGLFKGSDSNDMGMFKLLYSQIYCQDRIYIKQRNTKERINNWDERTAKNIEIEKWNYLIIELGAPERDEFSKMW
jgi:hypothetical protein